MSNRRKTEVNVTGIRQNLPAYLAKVQKSKEIEFTSRGKMIARIVAGGDKYTFKVVNRSAKYRRGNA